MIAILGKQNVDYMTGKRDHFVVLATVQSDIQCKIKKTLIIGDLKPVLNENVGGEKILLYWPFYIFSSRFNWVCLLPFTFSLSLLFLLGISLCVYKFNCTLGNPYFWRCMLEHTKRQVHKWRFWQHALSSYVYYSTLNKITQFWLVESNTINLKLYSVGVPNKFPWKRRNFVECTINLIIHTAFS